MESLDWGNELEESLIMAGANIGLIYNNTKNFEQTKLDTYTNQSDEQIQKTETFSNLWPQWNSRSVGGSSWGPGVAVNSGTSRSCIDYGRPCAMNTIIPSPHSLQNSLLMRNSSDLDHQSLMKQVPPMATKTASFDSSLDCLLSASTDTATTSPDQDDGISLLFSDHCNSLWNFAASSNTAPSPSPSPPPSNVNAVVSRNSKENIINQSASSLPAKRRRDATTPIGLSKQKNLDFRSGSENREKPEKKARLDKQAVPSSSNINFQQTSSSASSGGEEADAEAIAQMKEIIYRAAAFRPVNFGAEAVERPRRKNVRVSNDPQTVAARQRRERISERIRVLQKLVPGGSKMDTASMLDEAANYLKFLRSQVKALEALGNKSINDPTVHNFPANASLAFPPFINYSFAMQQPQFSIHNPNQSKT